MDEKPSKPKWFAKNLKRSDEPKREIVIRKVGRPIEWTQEAIAEEARLLGEWIKDERNYYFDRHLVERGLSHEHIARFCQMSEDFRETFSNAKKIQEVRLVEHALTKEHDGNFTKFVLANRAGWKERTELSGDVKNPLSFVLSSIDSSNKDITLDASAITDQSKDDGE